MTPILKTNHNWRPFLTRADVPKDVLSSQFDWLSPEETFGFIRYQGQWNHLSQFERTPASLEGWTGYWASSMTTGLAVKVSNDGDSYQIASYRVVS